MAGTVMTETIVALVAGLAVGALVAWLATANALRGRAAAAERDLAVARARLEESGSAQTAAVEALLERAKNELRDATAERAGDKVGDVVAPMNAQLAEFRTLIASLEESRNKDAGSLRAQIGTLLDRTDKLESAASQLSTQTSTLVTALRNPTTRGKWGEMQLRNVVEKAGMTPFCDFAEQQTIGVEGGRARPDMTVNLPGDRCVFVDAKAPIDAMQAALEAPDDAARKANVKAYARALQDHVDALARRNYQSAEGSAGFVIMFVPGESFLSAACTENPGLLEYAMDKGVMIAGPMNLVGLLQTFAIGWQAVRQEENAKRIAAIGRELYERAQKFAEHFVGLRKNLERTVESFNQAVGSYESRLLPQGRKLKDEAALPGDDLPEIGVIDTAPRAVTALDAAPKSTRIPRTQQLPLQEAAPEPDANSA